METHSSCWLVTNPGSGSNTPESTESLRDDLLARGIRIEREIGFPEDDLPTLSQLDRADARLVVTYAGDGTVNAVLSALEGWEGAVLVLPGGTMNLLSRRLHGELEIAQILDLVAAGSSLPVRASTVTCEGGTAYAGLLVGPGTCWNRVRETMRDFDLPSVAEEAVEAIRTTQNGPFILPVDRVSSREGGYPLIEMTPGEHGIQLDGYYAEEPAEYAAQAWATLRRQFREGPHDRMGIVKRIALRSVDGSPLPCLFDGEPGSCPSGSLFEMKRSGVDLLATGHDS
jgi:hypothetical protein